MKKRFIMKRYKQNPFLYFNFADHNGELHPLQFERPIQILTAQTINEIMPCMKMIQQAVKDGFYAAGYISYEAAPAFNNELPVKTGNIMPLLWFGIFNDPINQKLEHRALADTNAVDWKPTVSVNDYNNNFDHIQQLIKNKITKQVNYTIPFESHFISDPLSLYKELEHAQSANYSAFIDTDEFSVISASPELFFHLRDGEIKTRPMKGTIGRGYTYHEDVKHAKWLRNSKKDQTENRLIIELMREELSEIAIPDTIHTPNLYTIEKYPTVYQMTSTVKAKIHDHIELIDIFKALFPCGSITGIPKKDTMAVITELETTPREVYCGAIGYITPDNEAIFNVPIRTALINKKTETASYGVGGAITKDSKKENEYEEVLIKTRLLTKKHHNFKLLESLGLIDGEYLVFKEHLKRLMESALYFDFNIHLDKIQHDLINLSKKYRKDSWKVRLLLDKDGSHSIEIEKLVPVAKEVTVKLSHQPIHKDNFLLYHKTTDRSVYETNLINELFDTLLWNTEGEVTEFTMGNIVVELNKRLYTPPLHSGLLAGTFRESLLEKEIITERKIMINELDTFDNIWFINSVRQWIPVHLLI